MRICFISDTHGKHHSLTYYSSSLPQADMICHTGDISSGFGSVEETNDFLQWYSKLNFKYKIFIAGNHDFPFENSITKNLIKPLIPNNIIYLENSGVEIEGINIWGSPVTPSFGDWAFNVNRGYSIEQIWKKIPNKIDILLTHGPAWGILDLTVKGVRTGCEELLKKINILKPKIHACGHIHEGYGIVQKNETIFINSSFVDEYYVPGNPPFVIDL